MTLPTEAGFGGSEGLGKHPAARQRQAAPGTSPLPTEDPVGAAINRQRKRERAARDHLRVALDNGASGRTLFELELIVERESYYGD